MTKAPSRRPRPRPRTNRGRSLVGQRYEVRAERVGHGGFVVARHEGVVVFVRHALPGERVVAEVTDGREGDRFLRADAVEVLEASADRVQPPCPYARPGRCGGCDFQHVALPAQRLLKAAVVEEQLERLAGIRRHVVVEPVPGDVEGLDWRTRVQWAVAEDGTVGLRKHRSHEVVAIDDCRIADPRLPAVRPQPGATSVETLVSSDGELLVLTATKDGVRAEGPEVLHESAVGRTWQVTGSGFWQVHPGAADTLASAVLDGLRPTGGERALDLYAGVGLFSAPLALAVGPGGRVRTVEGDPQAADDAVANLADLPQVEVVHAPVHRALEDLDDLDDVDLVVLDPPRTGAKADVVAALAALAPRAVAYVACDPAALARDLGYFAEHGYRLESLRAFDLFPMTHHVECVAVLGRA